MQYRPVLLIPFLVICLLPTMHAQTDSLSFVRYPTQTFTARQLDRNLVNELEDTSLNRNEVYLPLIREHMIFQDLGNVGTAGVSQQFTFNRPADFIFGFNPWSTYFKTPEKTRYYRTRRPYADFNYVQGQQELLIFKSKFTMNLTPHLNVGVDFDRFTSLGFYPRQFTSSYFTNVFSSYQSKGGKYTLLANSIWNRGVNDESGGIRSDSLFESLNGSNKAVPVWLRSSQTRFKGQTLFLKQYFYLGSTGTHITDQSDTLQQFNKLGFLSHTIRFDHNRFAFDNPDGDTANLLFPIANLDSTGIFYDSVQSRTFMNRLTWASWLGSNEKRNHFLEVGISHNWIRMLQYGLANEYHNVWTEARAERILKSNQGIGWTLEGAFCLSGYNQADFKAAADLFWKSEFFMLEAGFLNQLQEADYFMNHYRSAPFSWENRFDKVNVTSWHGGFATRRFRNNLKIQFNQFLLANWVYYGQSVNPLQSSTLILVNTAEVKKTFQLNVFYFEHRLLWQKTNLNLIRLPEFSVNLRYYLDAYLFKKALHFQLGAELYYHTAYYANAWNPSVRVFHLQDEVEVGNYPMLGGFITGQIKTATIFAKMEHLNMDWKNSGFYYTPHYPIPVKAFRLGIRWRMYN